VCRGITTKEYRKKADYEEEKIYTFGIRKVYLGRRRL
jgi:hypothetical protein